VRLNVRQKTLDFVAEFGLEGAQVRLELMQEKMGHRRLLGGLSEYEPAQQGLHTGGSEARQGGGQCELSSARQRWKPDEDNRRCGCERRRQYGAARHRAQGQFLVRVKQLPQANQRPQEKCPTEKRRINVTVVVVHAGCT
jgi:hypothetical protein